MSFMIGALLCGFIGLVIGLFAGIGTSILIPGLGLVVAGWLFLGIMGGSIGLVAGSLLGLLTAAVIIAFRRGKNIP